MHQNLCDKYGFDKVGREHRLAMIGLGQEDMALAQQLHTEVLVPNCDTIVDKFYDFLGSNRDMARFLAGPDIISRLKKKHVGYLLSLGLDYQSESYFENRLFIGAVHARIGLPLSYYLAAYRLLEELIIRQFPQSIQRQPQQFLELSAFVKKIASLDVTLAIEIYHHTKVEHLLDSVHDLLDEKQQLTSQVQSDDLTQLASRRYLLEVLTREQENANQGKEILCVAMADLDHFKQINDQQGHIVGDRVLKEVAQRILSSIRDEDTVGRYGGEEFLLILPHTPLEIALQIAERIRQHIARTAVHLRELSIPTTISIGVVQHQPGEDAVTLIRRADEAMYRAKQAGRNTVST